MLARRRNGERRQAGQTLVLAVLFLTALLGMTGLIIDGANGFAQQRIMQGGTDAAAEAGAVVIAQMITQGATASSTWDGATAAAITSSTQANKISSWKAYYVDICGALLTPTGAKASGPGSAAEVGSGNMPPDTGANPDCPSGKVGPVQGVEVIATKTFNTYVASAVGIDTMTATTSATAIAGFPEVAGAGTLIPLIVPVFIVQCDGSGKIDWTPTPWPINQDVTVPICKNSDGNIGWLEWPGESGGTANLIDSIQDPDNPPIAIPSWEQVMLTGDKSASGVVSAMNALTGRTLLFLMFDGTCQDAPGGSALANCTSGGATGTKGWYHVPRVAAFTLKSFETKWQDCGMGNNVPACLKGRFVYYITTGTVGPGYGGGGNASQGGAMTTQLIK